MLCLYIKIASAIEKLPFLSFKYQLQISPVLLYIRCKSKVTFIQRCFRDGNPECLSELAQNLMQPLPRLNHWVFQIKFNCNRPADLRDIHGKWTDVQRLESRPISSPCKPSAQVS